MALGRKLLFLLAFSLPLLFALDSLLPKFFIFDPAKLQSLSRASIAKHGDDTEALMRDLVVNLRTEYPGIVEAYDEKNWVFNVAGGATGQMNILHASISEYLILFGTGSGTEGHSGAHLADDYFTILTGHQTASFLGELRPRVYTPGQQHHHPKLTSAHYYMGNGSWALELAQGFIPGMLPFGLVQMPMSLDLDSLVRTVWYTGRSVVLNLLRGKI